MRPRHIYAALLCTAVLSLSTLNAQVSPEAAPVVRALENHYHNVKTLKAAFSADLPRWPLRHPGRIGHRVLQPPGSHALGIRIARDQALYRRRKDRLVLRPCRPHRDPLADEGERRLAHAAGVAHGQGQAFPALRARHGGQCPRPPVRSLRAQLYPARHQASQGRSADASGAAQEGVLSPAPYDRVLLEVDSATGELADVRILQHGGVELEFRFGQWQQGLPLEAAMFRFQTPPGVAVLDEPLCPR